MKVKELHELFDREKVREIAFEGACKDCKKETTVIISLHEDGFVITGGAVYKVHNAEDYKGEETFIIKCNKCFEKEKDLTNFQECEVYSRVVGYLRPTKQWNPGKVEEFKNRKVFDSSIGN